jgi:hypothetical protein
MEVPPYFYERFKWKTLYLALGTGCLAGLFVSYLGAPILTMFFQIHPLLAQLIFIIAGGLVAMLFSRLLVRKYASGAMRGAFEFVYLESTYENTIEYQLSSTDRTGELELASLLVYRQLMSHADALDEEGRFWCYMAAAKAANAGSEDRNSLAALKLAVALRPKDIVVNFKLARTFERIGSAQEAIAAYEAASHDPSIDSDALKGFIAAQVKRVKEKGPEQRSPIPGLIYQLM